MKICITGATGFLGSQVVRQLYPLGYELLMIVRNKELVPDELKANHTVIRADLTKPIDPITCDVLIHCAALVSEKTLSFYLNKANIDGTRNILNAIPKEAKVIHISCSSVYNLTQRLHNEGDEINPTLLTPYGRSKLKSEQVLKEEFGNRNAYILRIQNLYGMRNTDLLKRLVKLYKGGELKVPGDLDQKVTMTHVDYLIELIKRLIDFEFSGIECLNVVDPKEYNLKEVCVKLLGASLNREVEIRELNELYLRIIAGARTVLIPGNQFTQTAIDFLTRDHVLNIEKLKGLFPNLGAKDFHKELPKYKEWITNIGLTQALKSRTRIYWE